MWGCRARPERGLLGGPSAAAACCGAGRAESGAVARAGEGCAAAWGWMGAERRGRADAKVSGAGRQLVAVAGGAGCPDHGVTLGGSRDSL